MAGPNERAPAYVAVPYDVRIKKEEPARGTWNHSIEFILSCVGFAVGLGNVWRFPYLCYRNGGGAFLIPYIIMLAITGLPLFVLELGFGQFASKGCVSIWAASPVFKGIGLAMCVITTLLCCYYNVIIAYTIFYLFASFSKVLPWSSCGNPWNTPNCTVSFKDRNSYNVNATEHLDDMTVGTDYNSTNIPLIYQTRPSMEFWDNNVLQRTDGIHDLGTVRWQLLLCLLFAWVVVYLCIMRGVKSSGKVVYVTATFPYLVLLILFIRGVTLPGAIDGIIFYIKPNFSKLNDARVWKDAAVQIFFSLGPAFGCLPTLASYHKFDNNFQRDGIIISLINCCTSIFAGFVIFSVIGFMSHTSGIPVEKVADSGPGLAFVAYPEAISMMPIAPVWAVLFFLMLFTLGLDSMFAYVETIITAICDELQQSRYPDINKKKPIISLLACTVMFLVNISMVTQGGIYVVMLLDNYSASMSVLVVAFMECFVISYVYGIDRFYEDMYHMLGFHLSLYWKICWMLLSPLVLLFIFIFYAVNYSPLTYADYRYAPWAEGIGWLMVAVAIAMIPGYAIYFLNTNTTGSPLQRLRYSIRPATRWGPAHNQDRITAGYPIIDEQQMKDPEPDTPPPEYASVCVDGYNQTDHVGEISL